MGYLISKIKVDLQVIEMKILHKQQIDVVAMNKAIINQKEVKMLKSQVKTLKMKKDLQEKLIISI